MFMEWYQTKMILLGLQVYLKEKDAFPLEVSVGQLMHRECHFQRLMRMSYVDLL